MRTHRQPFAPLVLAASLAALGSALPAAAQQAVPSASAVAPGTPADQADILYREGVELGKAGQWPKAYPKLLHAFQLKKSFDIAINLGTAEFNVHKFTDSAEHLHYGLSIFPPNGKPDQKKAAEELLSRAKSQVGTVRLKVSPANADLSINGRALGPDQRTVVFVEPGDVTVEAGAESYEAFSKTVKVEKGGAADVEVQLKALPGVGPTASVTTTAAPTSVPVSPGPNKVVLGTGLGLTAVGLGLGIGLLVGGAAAKADADKLREDLLSSGNTVCAPGSPPVQCKEFTDAAGNYATLTNAGGAVLIGTAVIGLSTAIYAIVARPKKETAPAPKVALGAGPNGATVLLTGNF